MAWIMLAGIALGSIATSIAVWMGYRRQLRIVDRMDARLGRVIERWDECEKAVIECKKIIAEYRRSS